MITAQVANTPVGDPATITAPARSGPKNTPVCWIMPATTLAAIRSLGVWVSVGSSQPITGRVNEIAAAASALAVYTSNQLPDSIARATTTIAADCDGVPAGERTLRPEPVACVRGERCDQDRGDELEERDEPDLLGPATLERVEQHGQPGGVLADGESGVREQHPSELAGPTDAQERIARPPVVHASNHATAKGTELVAMWANTGAIRWPDRWRSQMNPSPATNVAANVPTIVPHRPRSPNATSS